MKEFGLVVGGAHRKLLYVDPPLLKNKGDTIGGGGTILGQSKETIRYYCRSYVGTFVTCTLTLLCSIYQTIVLDNEEWVGTSKELCSFSNVYSLFKISHCLCLTYYKNTFHQGVSNDEGSHVETSSICVVPLGVAEMCTRGSQAQLLSNHKTVLFKR